MSYREDEKRWKRIQDMLAAEASGKTLRPTVSQRTLFGIPSTMEQTIDRIVAEDEEARRMKRIEQQLEKLLETVPVEAGAQAFDVPDVVALERTIDAAGTPLAELMDRAGTALARRVHAAHPEARVAVLCGNGNNGGDGWVAARALSGWGHNVALATLRTADELNAQPAHDTAVAIAPVLAERGVNVLVNPADDEVSAMLADADVIIDALLGTGFTGQTVKEPFDRWINLANERHAQGAFTVAADAPSGLNAQTGTASEPCVQADETVTMIVVKTGLLAPEAAAYCGSLFVAPLIDIEPYLSA